MKPGACCVNSKAQESSFFKCTHFITLLFSSEMPDRKAEDEVDFLSKTRASSVSEEVAIGNGATTPRMKQSPKTQAVSGISKHRMCLLAWSPVSDL